MSVDEGRLTSALREVLTDELGPLGQEVDFPDELLDSTLVLIPGKGGSQERELPLSAIVHKIVLAREKLRLVEQTVNASKGLSDADRLALQVRITRVQTALVSLASLLNR